MQYFKINGAIIGANKDILELLYWTQRRSSVFVECTNLCGLFLFDIVLKLNLINLFPFHKTGVLGFWGSNVC